MKSQACVYQSRNSTQVTENKKNTYKQPINQ